MAASLDDLRRLVRRQCPGDHASTAIPGVSLHTGAGTTDPLPVVYPTMVCFVLQGAKRVTIGGRAVVYRGESYMLLSVDLPVTGQVIEATGTAPYLAISLLLDPATLAALVLDMPAPQRVALEPAGLAIGALTPDVLEPLGRLVGLLDRPADIPVLAPLAERELLYRLLQGAQAPMLRELALADSRLGQIRRAVAWIGADVTRPLRIEALAAHVGMSTSSFHRHFKAVTGMSPLQYQKQVRLQEARRRLLADPGDVASVAFAVGYESASQFTREYARAFGMPPRRDSARLRATSEAGVVLGGS
jgi:AraC-like DNA-binding protein